MGKITRSTDMDDFLRAVGFSFAELAETLKELAKDGFVTKTGKGYAIAEKGKLALKAFTVMPQEQGFRFYTALDQPADVSAQSVKEFYDVVGSIDTGSLEFHLERKDFENWFKTSVEDEVFAHEFSGLGQTGLKGEALRKQMLLNLEARFGEDALNREWET